MNYASSESITPPGRLNDLRLAAELELQAQYSRTPHVVAAAPGRVNLIGEHVDYNDGFVLPMAIERYVVIAAAPASDRTRQYANLYSIDQRQTIEVPLGKSSQPTLNGWGRYLEGVVAGFGQLDVVIPPFDAVIGSDIPTGGGLSSSAALEVATATLLESLTGRTLEPIEKAVLCQQAEHRFAGVPCGIMDQFSSVFGKPNELMLLDCRSHEIEPVAFDSDEVSILITNSNVRHDLAGGEYAQRRSECELALKKLAKPSWREVSMTDVESNRELLGEAQFARSQHVVSEDQRTLQAADAFRVGDWGKAGELMYASHASLRDQFKVSCTELDLLVDLAKSLGCAGGVYGSRMTGGGFGGSTVSLVRSESVKSITEFLHSRYEQQTGFSPHLFASRPALGAHLIKTDHSAK